MAKKILAVLFVFLSLILSSTSVSYAAEELEPWKPSTNVTEFANYRAAIEDDNCMTPSLECLVHQVFTFASLEFINTTLYSDVEPNIGPDGVITLPTSYDPNNPTQIGAKANKGILHATGNLIGNFYNYPVANTRIYVADIMNSAHVTPQAYAQGLGFASLNPILDLWKAFRNLAYMFFVIIFMIIGFMIMFRQRIGGQAAVTAQQAIPGVIISLILVTFSYAIAGLLIDFMYLIMFLIIGVFGDTLPNGSENLIDMNIRQVTGVLFTGAVGDIGANSNLVSGLLGSLVASESLLGETASVVGGLTLTVVLAIAILIGTVKLFFELLKSYASIVLSVVTSPLVLMQGAIPGKNPVVTWIKDLIGNLLPFPVVLLVLVLFFQFKENAIGDTAGGFMPPFLLAQGAPDAIADLLGLALILALPEIVKDSKKGLVSEGFGTMVFKAATESAKKGWTGGEIIPGVAATNTANLPYVGKYIGGGKQALRTMAVGAPTVAAGGGSFIKNAASWTTGRAINRVTRSARGGSKGWIAENPFVSATDTGKNTYDYVAKKTGLKKEDKKSS